MTPAVKQGFEAKLKIMAAEFPSYTIVDYERLERLITTSEAINSLVQDILLLQIESKSPRYLEQFAELCLCHSFINLAHTLIQYCLQQEVVTGEIKKSDRLVHLLIQIIAKYELDEYIDIEQASDRANISFKHFRFAISVSRIKADSRLSLLKILHNSYVRKITNKDSHNDYERQALNIKKYNNIVRLVRRCDQELLQDARWSRLYTMDDLGYSKQASSELFREHCPGPDLFDEMLYENFGILLIPAFGEVQFEAEDIVVLNEGKGSIRKPTLEIFLKESKLFRVFLNDIILPGRSGRFRLNKGQINTLRQLSPNKGKIRLLLRFDKFGGTPFGFDQSVDISTILNALPSKDHVLIETINSDRELFETIYGFMVEIRRTVEQDKGWRSLLDKPQTLKNETEIQIQLKHWLDPKCEKYNINLQRESLGGRGNLDFVLSIGQQWKCIIEVKPFDSTRLEHGLSIQLPTYLQAEKARFGIYVPIIPESSFDKQKLDELQSKVDKINKEYDFEIHIIDIYAWKPKSASVADCVDDPGRYKNPWR